MDIEIILYNQTFILEQILEYIPQHATFLDTLIRTNNRLQKELFRL